MNFWLLQILNAVEWHISLMATVFYCVALRSAMLCGGVAWCGKRGVVRETWRCASWSGVTVLCYCVVQCGVLCLQYSDLLFSFVKCFKVLFCATPLFAFLCCARLCCCRRQQFLSRYS